MNTPKIYYNEHNPHAAQWLRNLMSLGVIAQGIVDERSIEDVTPSELMGFTQCHFFAGIGVWPFALRCAGWDDDRPVWTGSCPCQPFSAAGKGAGFADERHLWPAWFHLIQHGKGRGIPVFGEQVASADGLEWFDIVCTDMENAGNACWSTDLCAAGFGGPNIRQRLYFLAHAVSSGWPEGRPIAGDGPPAIGGGSGALGHAEVPELEYASPAWGRRYGLADTGAAFGLVDPEGGRPDDRGHRHEGGQEQAPQGRRERQGRGRTDAADAGEPDGMDNPAGARCEGRAEQGAERETRDGARLRGPVAGCGNGGMADPCGIGLQGQRPAGEGAGTGGHDDAGRAPAGGSGAGAFGAERTGPLNGFWRNADWLRCRDGKWRPVESGTFPLVNGSAFDLGSGGPFEGKSRAKILEGYGHALNRVCAQQFIRAAMDYLAIYSEAA